MRTARPAAATGVRLSRAHERWVYGSFAALLGSGALWLLFHHCVSVQTEFGAQPHPLEAWWLSLHGAAAMAFLIVLGTLLPVHVRRSWQARKNQASGALLLATAAALTLSGYGLYYLGSEELRPWLSIAHWGIGLGAAGVLIAHVALGKRALRRRRGAARQPAERAAPALRAISAARFDGSRSTRS